MRNYAHHTRSHAESCEPSWNAKVVEVLPSDENRTARVKERERERAVPCKESNIANIADYYNTGREMARGLECPCASDNQPSPWDVLCF